MENNNPDYNSSEERNEVNNNINIEDNVNDIDINDVNDINI
ncbi:uncharacterized protein METZ01_LOCUS197710, partial [marine metagenome]